jgi:hypothetical protein
VLDFWDGGLPLSHALSGAVTLSDGDKDGCCETEGRERKGEE